MRPINAKTRDLTAALVRTVLNRHDLNAGVEAAAMALILLTETLVNQHNADAEAADAPEDAIEFDEFLVAVLEAAMDRRHQPDLRLVVDDKAAGGVSTIGPDMKEDDARLWALQTLGPYGCVELDAASGQRRVGRLEGLGTSPQCVWLGVGVTWETACRAAADRISTAG